MQAYTSNFPAMVSNFEKLLIENVFFEVSIIVMVFMVFIVISKFDKVFSITEEYNEQHHIMSVAGTFLLI